MLRGSRTLRLRVLKNSWDSGVLVDRPDVRTCDESQRIRKPLFAEVKSLGPIANDMLALLKSQGVPDDTEYMGNLSIFLKNN